MFSMKKHDVDELQQIGCTRSVSEIRYVHSEAYRHTTSKENIQIQKFHCQISTVGGISSMDYKSTNDLVMQR